VDVPAVPRRTAFGDVLDGCSREPGEHGLVEASRRYAAIGDAADDRLNAVPWAERAVP